MPAKRESEAAKKAAAEPRRTRKAPARAQAQAAPTAAAPRAARPNRSSRLASAAKAPKAPVVSIVPPVLPVSPRGPASAEADVLPQMAAPVPEEGWREARPPLTATLAFMTVLGALMLGYWAGHAVGSGSEPSAVPVVQAAERPVSPSPAATPAATEATAVEPDAPQIAAPAGGLHLQVSALSSERAAARLRRQLEEQGFPVRVEPPSNDRFVRVYVGPVPGDGLPAWTSQLRKKGLQPFPKRL